MTKVEFAILFVPFVEGEVDNPAVGDFVGILKLEVVGEGDTELTENFVDLVVGIGTEEDGITFLGGGEFGDAFDFGVGHELENR